jgi:hypothetical protein
MVRMVIEWRCGSSGRVPTLQVQSPKFKPQSYQKNKQTKNYNLARRQWFTSIILAAIQEAEIRKIMIQSQPRQIVWKTLSGKNTS